jgi:hypothetical protein
MNNYKLVWTAKIGLQLFQQYFTPPSPFPKQGESKTILGPDMSQAHPSYAQQFPSLNVQIMKPDVRSRDLFPNNTPITC